MMVRVALWDRCVLHPTHDAPRSLFARAKPAPGNEAVGTGLSGGCFDLLSYQSRINHLLQNLKKK